MWRVDVIQEIINKKNASNYLEVGVCEGECFFKINAKRKFAVDPFFSIDPIIMKSSFRKFLKKILYNSFVNYYPITSDEFFKKNKYKFDVVFVDGLHTHQQSLKDVLNVLDCLNDNGVIIMHDCNPSTESQAHPSKSHDDAAKLNLPCWTGEWCGDVWKTVVNLRSKREDLQVFVLNCDYGLGVIKKGKSQKLEIELTEKEIENLPYQYLNLLSILQNSWSAYNFF